jgi:hypothetical protein
MEPRRRVNRPIWESWRPRFHRSGNLKDENASKYFVACDPALGLKGGISVERSDALNKSYF